MKIILTKYHFGLTTFFSPSFPEIQFIGIESRPPYTHPVCIHGSPGGHHCIMVACLSQSMLYGGIPKQIFLANFFRGLCGCSLRWLDRQDSCSHYYDWHSLIWCTSLSISSGIQCATMKQHIAGCRQTLSSKPSPWITSAWCLRGLIQVSMTKMVANLQQMEGPPSLII